MSALRSLRSVVRNELRGRGSYVRLVIGNISAGVAALLTAVLIARFAGDAGKGAVALVTLAGLLGGLFADCGVSATTVLFAKRSPERRSALEGFLLLWFLLGGVLAAAIGSSIAWFSLASHASRGTLVWLSAAIAVPTHINATLRQLMLADGHHSAFNVSTQVEAWATPVGLLAILAAGVAFDPQVIAYQYLVAAGLTSVHALTVNRWRPSLRGWEKVAADVRRFGLPSHLGMMLQYLNYRVDVVMTGRFAGAAALGVYSVGVNIAEILWRIPRLAAQLLYSRVAGAPPEDARAMSLRWLRRLTIVTVGASVLLGLCAVSLIPLAFGDEFRGAIPVLWVLAPGICFASAQLLMVEYLKGRGEAHAKPRAALAGVVVTAGIGLLLIPKFGAMGAAITSTAAYATSMVVAFRYYARETGYSLVDALLGSRGNGEPSRESRA